MDEWMEGRGLNSTLLLQCTVTHSRGLVTWCEDGRQMLLEYSGRT